MAVSIRENIRLALGEELASVGYTILATNEKWNRYTKEEAFPLAKLCFDGVSKPVAEYANRKVQRSDELSIYIAPWNNSTNFEDITSLVMESFNHLFIEDSIKARLPESIAPKLGKITVGDMVVMIPDASGDNTTPYAMVKITISVHYVI